MGEQEEERIGSDVVSAVGVWAESFVAAPLPARDAADLVAGAFRTSRVTLRAAAQLDWLTADTFVDAMRRAEQRNDR